MTTARDTPIPEDLRSVMRELVNAHAKASMYPSGHKHPQQAAEGLAAELSKALEVRGSVTLGFTPKGLLVDGTAIDPLPAPWRQLAIKLHTRGIGTMHFLPGVVAADLVEVMAAVATGKADDEIAKAGMRRPHLRVEPLQYEVLVFGDAGLDRELEDVFWAQLVEAALGQIPLAGEPAPTAQQIAAAINERATKSVDHARRIYEALASFASALAVRREQKVGSARKRFSEILSAISRPAATAVLGAVPSKSSRRRFIRETLEQVPASLILQILDSVADADGEPLSENLRWLLGKLAGQELGDSSEAEGDFATQVLALMEFWDSAEEEIHHTNDGRVIAEPVRLVSLGLETDLDAPPIAKAATGWVNQGHLDELLKLLDSDGVGPNARELILNSIVSKELLGQLLAEATPAWETVSRVVSRLGVAAVDPMLSALAMAEKRTLRRRLIEQLVAVGPEAEDLLLARLQGSEWYLVRNVLGVLAQLPELKNHEAVLPLIHHDDNRVKFEALKVLLNSETTREEVLGVALESGEDSLVRVAMAALSGDCPPKLVAPLLSVLSHEEDDMVQHAIRIISNSENPLVVAPLLDLVREPGGLFRRWKLAPTSPVMLSALEVLARKWYNHRPVVLLLQMAARSGDFEVKRVIAGGQW